MTTMQNIDIINPDHTDKLIQEFTHDGPQKLHIVTDFDKTLTKAYVDGKARASLVSILRDNNHLISPEYAKKAHELFNFYHPQEKDPHISPEKKKAIVQERYDEHLKLLIQVGLTRDIIHQAIDLGTIQLRDKTKEGELRIAG